MPLPHSVFLLGLIAGGLAAGLVLTLRLAFRNNGVDAGRVGAPIPRAALSNSEEADVLSALARFELETLAFGQRELRELVGLGEWQQVYETLGVLDYSPEDMEAVLIARLAVEVGWTKDQQARLTGLLAEERATFTREAIQRHGREGLYAILDLPREARRDFMRQLGLEREAFRRAHDWRYARHFDEQHRAAIDRHLRSGSIHLVRNTGDRSVSITGVGLSPPTDVGESE